MKTMRVVGAIVTLCVLASARASLVARQDDVPWPPPGVYAWVPGHGVTLPQLVRQVGPQYTSDAMRANIQGVVVIGCVVEVDGTVGATRVLRSLDRWYGLDENALKAAKLWRFTPGMKDGVAVPVAVTIDMAFMLRPAPVLSWPESFATTSTSEDLASARTDDDVDA
jgi:TonB family protein